MLEEIADNIRQKLKNQHVPPRILLDRFRLIDENSRRSGQYLDPNYLPFYYHLSKFVHPKEILHVGLDLGLPSCCFLLGSKSVTGVLGFQRKSKFFYSPRIAVSNMRDVKGKKLNVGFHYGSILDDDMQKKMSGGVDLVLITERCSHDQISETLEVCWERTRLDGFLVVDHISGKDGFGDVCRNFCKSKNAPFIDLATRYGTMIIRK